MEAASLLKDFLEGKKHEDACRELRVSRQTLWSWLNGHSSPGEAAKLDIESYTDGAVPASSWPVVDRRKKGEEPAA